ncbi:MAG: ammonium transporter [Alphaproteobacteria bacterium]|nr:ammonium transporter [Alphaproteobacteria bacterium]
MDKGDTAWMLVSSLLVLMMTLPGLALFYGGLVRKDNVLATLMQTLAVACIISLVWPIIGYTLVFTDGNGWAGGLSKIFMKGVGVDAVTGTIPETVFMLFQMKFAIITCAIILGSVADRIKFSAVMIFSVLWCILVYCPIAHWVWGPGGFLGGIGLTDYKGVGGFGTALDFAGGTVVHISSGVAGLVAALVIGKSVQVNQSSSNNLILSVLGASLLWVGWFGFNAGSTLAANGLAGMAFLVTNTASATAGLAWVLIEWMLKGKPSVAGAISGFVAGLVAITPASGFVDFGASIAIGGIAAVFCFFAVAFLKEKLGYDDSLDAFGIHGVGGMVGAILTGVYASAAIGGRAGLLEGNSAQVVAQLISVLVTVGYASVMTFIILKVLKATIGLRVDEHTERSGLDLALHGEKVHVYN